MLLWRPFCAAFLLVTTLCAVQAEDTASAPAKASASETIQKLRDGNARFHNGKAIGPNRDLDRIRLAAASDQANFASTTVLSCSDSRVPVELIFDAGIMDLFVVRVAGNVADTDEIGTIEYGLSHVKTPVLLVLGHSGCGAVKAVTQSVQGQTLTLEANIPPLVENIAPAVKRTLEANPTITGGAIVPLAVEENVWQSVRDVFLKSAAVRELVAQGKVTVVAAVYDMPTGEVRWLDEKNRSNCSQMPRRTRHARRKCSMLQSLPQKQYPPSKASHQICARPTSLHPLEMPRSPQRTAGINTVSTLRFSFRLTSDSLGTAGSASPFVATSI